MNPPSTASLYPAGTAPVRAEYARFIETRFRLLKPYPLRFLISTAESLQPQVDDASIEEGTNRSAQKRKQEGNSNDDGSLKKAKLSGAERRKLSKEEKKAQRGSNKGRRWAKVRDDVDLCWRFAGSGKCDFGSECVLAHFLLPIRARYIADLVCPLKMSLLSRCTRLSSRETERHLLPFCIHAKP